MQALADLSSGAGAGGKKKQVQVVPYRDSMLTRLLMNALGGNSKTVRTTDVHLSASAKTRLSCPLTFSPHFAASRPIPYRCLETNGRSHAMLSSACWSRFEPVALRLWPASCHLISD